MPPYRRITLAVGVSMFVDASLYLAVLPLLPRYADQFGLNTFQVSLVLAAYPVSVPFVSLACIVLVPRVGARRISLASAVLMTVATITFAWAPNAAILILARFVQGLASGSIWTASMSWVTDNAPPGRRGRESGIVMGMLSAGSVAGPGIGALAAVAGSETAFGLVAAVSAVGVALTALAPEGRAVAGESQVFSSIKRGAAQPATIAALAISVIDLCAFGAVDLLVPLHLGDTGTSVETIAAAFAAGAVLGAVVGPIAGRVVDRVGPGVVGIGCGCGVLLIPVLLAFGPATTVQLTLLVLAGPLFAVVGAAMFPLSSLGADAARVSHVTVMGLMGVVWAAGFAVTPPLLGAVATSTSSAVAFSLAAALCLPALYLLITNVRRIEPVSRPDAAQPDRSAVVR
jgi:MFS transporter, DHA1 family, solute carrier family 18 (vesicular amine transporter), member 1/2